MDHESLKERTINQQAEREKEFQVSVFGDEITIDGLKLTLQENFKDAFDPTKLAVRYTPLLKQYDYIVGDLSADQLRLRGFYQEDRDVTADQKITALADYLYEYVNFGAPYFVLTNNAPAFRPVKVHDFLADWEQDHPKKSNNHKTNNKKKSANHRKSNSNETADTSKQKSAANQKSGTRAKKNGKRKHQFKQQERTAQAGTKKAGTGKSNAGKQQGPKGQAKPSQGKSKKASNQRKPKQAKDSLTKQGSNKSGGQTQASKNTTNRAGQKPRQRRPKHQENGGSNNQSQQNRPKKRNFTIKERKSEE